MNRVIVIGGGASGMAAAIAASRQGAKVQILEKNPRLGKKLLSTGNGRCNFTNINASKKDYNSDFVKSTLNKFSPKSAISFFEELGIMPKVEAEGRVYPLSGQASSVLDVLRMQIERENIGVLTEFDVKSVKKVQNGFEIEAKDKRKVSADKVIMALGGKASPKSGSQGEGYAILKGLGHTVTELLPSLAALKTDRGIQGVRQYGKVELETGESDTGELQFNAGSISGIPVFNISGYAKVGSKIFVDLMPDFSHSEVTALLKKRPNQPLESFLVGMFNKTLSQVLLKECGVGTLSKNSGSLTDKEFEKITNKIKCWDFEIIGLSPWDNAQVTKGGVRLCEVNPETLESLKVPGIYIVGELLDIDAVCGGYNLQWAWASGYVAGGEAARV